MAICFHSFGRAFCQHQRLLSDTPRDVFDYFRKTVVDWLGQERFSCFTVDKTTADNDRIELKGEIEERSSDRSVYWLRNVLC